MESTAETGHDPRGGGLEASALVSRLPRVSALDLEVVATESVTPAMRRVRLRGDGLADLVVAPGQDLMVAVPADGQQHFRRRYTVRRLDRSAGTVDLDVVLHGDGPGARWAATVRPGDRVEAIGPRGKITVVPGADWHLFAGDESALPATFAMVESLPASATAVVVLEVAGPEEEQPVRTAAALRLRWVHRGEVEPGHGTGLVDAVAAIDLPPGGGHCYLAGELRTVAAMRQALMDRGLDPGQLSPKTYWRLGVANAAHGEPHRE
ncbi:MAG TPA: siderophore-interacting protein [Acidimicrobiales bacterium]|nr:siderophore-interacting protein [Acidimicrobiales bacterium]